MLTHQLYVVVYWYPDIVFTTSPICAFSLFLFPPFSFRQKSSRAAENFDPYFTNNPVTLTPTDQMIIRALNEDDFAGFSYVNPYFQ